MLFYQLTSFGKLSDKFADFINIFFVLSRFRISMEMKRIHSA